MNPENYPAYFHPYIEKIPEGDPLELLELGIKETIRTLAMVSEEQANQSYEEGKWSIKDLLQHLIDTERIFSYRALAISRGEFIKLPGYDHNVYAKEANANNRSLKGLLEEFKQLRASTIQLFSSFSDQMMQHEGNANDIKIKVEQIQYILIGHELHHVWVLNQKYL